MSSWVVPSAYLLGVGWYIAITILIGGLIGHWVDGATGLGPTFTLIGIGLGLVVAAFGSFRMVVRFLRRFGPDEVRKD